MGTTKWRLCPKCEGETEIKGNVRSCLECDWSVTIPLKKELKEEYNYNG